VGNTGGVEGAETRGMQVNAEARGREGAQGIFWDGRARRWRLEENTGGAEGAETRGMQVNAEARGREGAQGIFWDGRAGDGGSGLCSPGGLQSARTTKNSGTNAFRILIIARQHASEP